VYTEDGSADRRPVIAVIGGGASGTLVVTHLLQRAARQRLQLRIALIDRDGRHGLGQAYSTGHPAHLLNTPAHRMSAQAGDADHLTRWAQAAGVRHDGFLPRHVFGRYLRETLADAERRAQLTASVTHMTSDVVAITRPRPGQPLRLHLAADGRVDADIAVLAIGNLPAAPPCPVPDTPRYIADPWAPGQLDRIADGSPVVVLGTGLTMMDVAVAVTDAHPATAVRAVSRHALLPRAHHGRAAVRPANTPLAAAGPSGSIRLAALMRQVRRAADADPDGWQELVDAMRPQIPQLWQRLAPADQRLFLRHVARYWEVHRHRVPPATAGRITALRSDGRLTVARGRVIACSVEPGRLRLRLDQDAGGAEISAGWLVNATGSAGDVTAASDPLLRNLFTTGLARPDPLRLGIDADAGGAVLDAAGRPCADIFTLGPPLRGQRYETTAVPEIRDQAAALARRLVESAGARSNPGSAA
jgi:uncharacterized NAD(P)/FAD-binding protein YdhS